MPSGKREKEKKGNAKPTAGMRPPPPPSTMQVWLDHYGMIVAQVHSPILSILAIEFQPNIRSRMTDYSLR